MIQILQRAFLLLFLVVGSSCLKAPSQNEDNGPEAPTIDVQKAIADAWGDADFEDIKLNEFLYIEQDQKISTLDPKVVYKEASQIINRTETADEINFKFLIRVQAMENGSFKPVTSFERDRSIQKVNSSVASQVDTKGAQTPALPNSIEELQKSMANGTVGVRSGNEVDHYVGALNMLNMLDACVKAEKWDVTCHNLRVSEGVMPPPTGVSSQQNCGGIPNCQIRYKKVGFDLVVRLDDGNGGKRTEKVIYDMTFSQDVPFLSRLLDFCYQGMVPTASQKVLVKICNRVQNFEPGQN